MILMVNFLLVISSNRIYNEELAALGLNEYAM